jgi:hypothetical protein
LLLAPEGGQVSRASALSHRYLGRAVSGVNLGQVPTKLRMAANDI